MNSWNDGIRNAICYIEDHLTKDIDVNEIASKAFVSSFYFQKIFHVLCGFTVGEYIKNRRLTLAAQELCSTDIRVLDAALKYGYSSPDSFAKAFTKFHGITPSQAREKLQPKFCCSAENKTYIGGRYYVRVQNCGKRTVHGYGSFP